MNQELKKCPHCGAEIEENARFCLYCMTSLDEKEALAPILLRKRQWLIIIAAFLALVMIGGGLWLALGKKEPASSDSQPESEVSAPEKGEDKKPSTEPSKEEGAPTPDAGTTPDAPAGTLPVTPGNTASGDPTNPGGNTDKNTVNTNNTTNTNDTTNTNNNTNTNNTTNTNNNTANTNNTNNTTNTTDTDKNDNPTTEPEKEQTPSQQPSVEQQPATPEKEPEQEQPTVTAAVYKYRDAQYGVDDYQVTNNVEDCVVITGIATPASDGVYQIPATIDGKTVIAIQKNAFYSDGYAQTVKKVYIPAKLRTIWDNAFLGCYNLTDIYLYGKSIYIGNAFPAAEKRNGTLTIHCAADCNNRDFRYYKNIAGSYYDARYEEWNG